MNTLIDSDFLFMLFVAVAAAATVITIGLPYLQTDRLSSRMKYVSTEREEMRKRERARLQQQQQKKGSLRSGGEAKYFVRDIVEKFKLRQGLATDDTLNKLKMAGMRGQGAIYTFLFFRLVLPFVLLAVSAFYMFVLEVIDQPPMVKIMLICVAAYIGFYLPNIYVTNMITKRQQSITRAWPDALDLLLICVESGMSIESAFKKVSQEIGSQSIPLAEEMSLTNAELSYLQDRRIAYENLGIRTGLDGVKAVVLSLIQAEKYGTPLGQSLRVMAQENRDIRMTMAEKKAAALPPKLTVPMIIFFLPVLFVVIMAPALMGVFATF